MLALSIKGLTKVYSNNKIALKGINLDIEKGECFALLGPNGAGKSTAIGIISSLVEKTSGSVSIMGYDAGKHPSLTKRYIGLVPQEFNCNFFGSIQNVLINQAGYFGISSRKAKVKAQELLEKLGLWDARKMQSIELSGGMKRRLLIARALVHDPKIVILDEPTAGVDIELRRKTLSYIENINNDGITIILTTHYLEEAEVLCNKVAIISKGEIIQNTDMSTLLQQLEQETYIINLSVDREYDWTFLTKNNYSFKKIRQNILEVDVRKNNSINILFELLNKNNIKISSIKNKINRLEKMFVDLINK